MAGIFSVACILGITFDPSVLEKKQLEFNQENQESDGVDEQEGKLIEKPKQCFVDFSALKEKMFVVLTVCHMLNNLGHNTPRLHLVKFSEDLLVSADAASRLFIYIGTTTFIGRLLSGFMCKLRCVNPLYVYMFGLVVDGSSQVYLSQAKTYTDLVVFSFLYGLADGIVFGTFYICILNSVEASRKAAAFGLSALCYSPLIATGPAIAAWVGSLAIAQYGFLGQLSTTLTTRFGARITSLIGGTFCAVSLVASSFVEDTLVLFFTYSIPFGFGCSCTYSSGLCVMGQYFKKRLSLATGVLTAGQGAGILILGPTLQLLLTATSWQVTYRIMAGVVFVLCSVAVTFDPNVETDGEGLMENQGATEEINEEGNTKSLATSLKEVFDISVWKEPRVVAFMLSDFVTAGGILVPQIHLVRYCEELGISAEKSSELLIYYGLFSAFGRLVGGILCNHPRVDALSVFQSAEIVIGLSTILVSLAATYYPLVIFAVIYGLCEGFFVCTLRYLLVSVSPRKTTAVVGWNMLLVSFFLASGPPLAGLLADKLGSYVVPFRVAGGITIAGGFIPFTLLCRKRSDRIDPLLQNDEDKNLLR